MTSWNRPPARAGRVLERWLPAATVTLAGPALLVGCTGPSTSEVVEAPLPGAKWAEEVWEPDLETLTPVMLGVTDDAEGGLLEPSAGQCDAVADWTSRAEAHPVPAEEDWADAWADLLDATGTFAAEACRSADRPVVVSGVSTINDALGDALGIIGRPSQRRDQ